MSNWPDAWKWAEKEVSETYACSVYVMREIAKEVQEEEALKKALKPRISDIVAAIERDIHEAAKQGKMKIEGIKWYKDTVHWGMNQAEMILMEPVIKKIFSDAGYICCDGCPFIDNKKRHYYHWGELCGMNEKSKF